MKQDVAVILRRAPYGRVHVPEGLRAARGVAAGFDQHDVTAVFTQDGVYAARESVDREALNMPGHIDDLLAEDGRMVVDRASMEERGVSPDEIAADITPCTADEIANILAESDHTLDF